MKLLYLTKYSRNGASSRLRSYQFFPFLEEHGFEVTVKPFFDEAYLVALYSKNKTSKFKLLYFYFKRFCTLFSIYKYDKVVIEKELFPYFFSWFEQLLWFFNIKYVVDYDDAIFHNYDSSNSKIIRFFLKKKIDNVMKYSSCVIAGNSYLANKAKQSGAKKIQIIPTVIDTNKYYIETKKNNDKVVIGWIGSPSTVKYIKNILNVLKKIIEQEQVELHLIGIKKDIGLGKNTKYIDWSETTEVDRISHFDIGIMPLENTAWERGKCAYKIIQYMGCGLPVVASSVGVNYEVVENGTNGYLVNNENEWVDKLQELIENKNLRNRFGKVGREKVIREYSIQNNLTKLISVLKES